MQIGEASRDNARSGLQCCHSENTNQPDARHKAESGQKRQLLAGHNLDRTKFRLKIRLSPPPHHFWLNIFRQSQNEKKKKDTRDKRRRNYSDIRHCNLDLIIQMKKKSLQNQCIYNARTKNVFLRTSEISNYIQVTCKRIFIKYYEKHNAYTE